MIRSKSVFLSVPAILAVIALASVPAGAAQTPSPTTPAKQAATTPHMKHATTGRAMAKLDLNSATKEELTKLPGIDEMTADRIIAARPFKTRKDLVTKNILGKKEYAAISSRVVVKAKVMANAAGK